VGIDWSSQRVGLELTILAPNRAFGNVARRQKSDLRERPHERSAARAAALGRRGRETAWPRRRASSHRRESPAQAAADRPTARTPPSAKPNAKRPVAVRIRVALLNPARIRKLAIALRPSTLLALHQALVHRKYRRLLIEAVSEKARTKRPNEALIRAIVELKSRNPRFGCPRIACIISQTFGMDIDKNVVYRVLARHYRPAPVGTGPSWLSFIGHTKDSLWSVGLFRCESIVLRTYWVLVVMDQFTRRPVGFGVHGGTITGVDVCRMLNAAVHRQAIPRYLSTDHDSVFEAHRWTANLRILEIDEVKTVPHVPMSHPFVERLIGTMRREFLDHVPFWP
jgi:putative transposase